MPRNCLAQETHVIEPSNIEMRYSASYEGDNKNTPKMEWKINEDSIKNILGYDCQLAETDFRGRNWKAWFTIDIPLSYGP